MILRKLMVLVFPVLLFSCKDNNVAGDTKAIKNLEEPSKTKLSEEIEDQNVIKKADTLKVLENEKTINDADFINIEEFSKDFVLDMRYATSNNFLKEKVYSCAKCYIRKIVAEALMKANNDFIKKGYRIKFFDCYRPHSVQKKMWKIFPNPGYVADPKGGSIHNKGAAVDITLIELDGEPVDMGTGFDHFGKEAHHSYNHSREIQSNRRLLRETMQKHGFNTIRTEWWHYNFRAGKKYKVSDFTWDCN